MINISEAAGAWDGVYRESWLPAEKWEPWIKKGYLKTIVEEEAKPADTSAVLDLRASIPPTKYELPVKMDKLAHQPHLENFFDAIRGNAKLNCPAEIGYETAVTVLKVNEAVEAARKLEFQTDEFKV